MEIDTVKLVTELASPQECAMSSHDIYPEFENALNSEHVNNICSDQKYSGEMNPFVSSAFSFKQVSEDFHAFDQEEMCDFFPAQFESKDTRDALPSCAVVDNWKNVFEQSTPEVYCSDYDNAGCIGADTCTIKHVKENTYPENDARDFEMPGHITKSKLEKDFLNMAFAEVSKNVEGDANILCEKERITSHYPSEVKSLNDSSKLFTNGNFDELTEDASQLSEDNSFIISPCQTNQVANGAPMISPKETFDKRSEKILPRNIDHYGITYQVTLTDGSNLTRFQKNGLKGYSPSGTQTNEVANRAPIISPEGTFVFGERSEKNITIDKSIGGQVTLADGRSFTRIQRNIHENEKAFRPEEIKLTFEKSGQVISGNDNYDVKSVYSCLNPENHRQLFYREVKQTAHSTPKLLSERNIVHMTNSHISEIEVGNKYGMKDRNKNTEKKVCWALRLFGSWYSNGQRSSDFEVCPLMLFNNFELNQMLMRFISEIRNCKGGPYKVDTLREILISLQYFLKQNGRNVQFSSDSDFVGLRKLLQMKTEQLSSMGYEVKKRKALLLTGEQDELLWQYGILGDDSPQKLVDTLFYLNSVCFGLRGAKEHHALKLGQSGNFSFKFIDGVKHLRFSANMNMTKRIPQDGARAQSIVVGPNLDRPERCPVRLLEKYLSLRPKPSRPSFYLRPIRHRKSDGVWFCNVPFGCQHLTGMVRKLCASAGFKGFYTNFSLGSPDARKSTRKNIREI